MIIDWIRACAAGAGLMLVAWATSGEPEHTTGRPTEVVVLARAFLATLDDPARTAATQPFDGDERKNWHYVPRERQGAKLGQLSDESRRALHALLRATLSAPGYQKVQGVLTLEEILKEIESRPDRPAVWRDPALYAWSLFGEPGDGFWGWRLEGHHLSLNVTYSGNDLCAATPFFLGSNPAEVPNGPKAGWVLLAGEEQLAHELLVTLNEAQRSKALIASKPPDDVHFRPGADRPPLAGISAGELTPGQRVLLMQLVMEYVRNLNKPDADLELARITSRGIPGLRFAWAGSTAPGEPFYYRIDGPHFVIEYDTVGKNHVHALWRDAENDFGADALRRHYAEEHERDK